MAVGPLLLKATGSVYARNRLRFKLLVFQGDKRGTSGVWPAVLQLVRESNGDRHLNVSGRLHGLEGGRAITVSCVTQHDTWGNAIGFGDVLRVSWDRATNGVTGTFVPPSAATLVAGIHAQLATTDDELIRDALRSEVERITVDYGATVKGQVVFIGRGLARIAKNAAVERSKASADMGVRA